MERLYFYRTNPTETQRAEAQRLGAKLRDARAVRNPPFKPCDEAYGDVPEQYLHCKVEPKQADSEPKPAKKKAKKKAAKKKAQTKKAD